MLTQLARGGTSTVYLGVDTRTGERVALKVLDAHWAKHEDLAARMLGELAVAARAQHPGLLEIYAADRTTDGTPYLVMELLDGENLGDLVDRGRVVYAAIAAIGAQVADAVTALHDAGIVHCDIKPDNVFVLYDPAPIGWPQVKLVDYGVSRIDGDPAPDSIAGTPSCMAPEQWRGAPTPKSDVYSLGCLLYWLTTGTPPFTGALPQLMLAHTNQLAARPTTRRANVPAELDRLVMRALAKDPGMRPTMRDFARDLGALAALLATDVDGELLEAAS